MGDFQRERNCAQDADHRAGANRIADGLVDAKARAGTNILPPARIRAYCVNVENKIRARQRVFIVVIGNHLKRLSGVFHQPADRGRHALENRLVDIDQTNRAALDEILMQYIADQAHRKNRTSRADKHKMKAGSAKEHLPSSPIPTSRGNGIYRRR